MCFPLQFSPQFKPSISRYRFDVSEMRKWKIDMAWRKRVFTISGMTGLNLQPELFEEFMTGGDSVNTTRQRGNNIFEYSV